MTMQAKTSKQCQEAYGELLTELTGQWWRKVCANPAELVYLMGHRNAAGIWSKLWVAADRYDDATGEFLRPEPMPRNVTFDHFRELLRGWLNREPLYVFAD